MRPIYQSLYLPPGQLPAVSGYSGVLPPVPIDQYIAPTQVSMTTQNDAAGTMQYTFDDPYDPNFTADTATWYPVAMSGDIGYVDFPVRAVWLDGVQTDLDQTFVVIQSGAL